MENAALALSLVGYDEQLRVCLDHIQNTDFWKMSSLTLPTIQWLLQTAMEYVFGSTFVCKTIDAAKEVRG